MASEVSEERLAAARVAGRAQLLDLRLVRLEHRLLDAEGPGRLHASIEFGTSSHQVDIDAGMVVYEIHFEISAGLVVDGTTDGEVEDEATNTGAIEDPIFELNGLYQMRFVVDGLADLSEDELESFGRTTALFGTYPYIRELVQSQTSRASLPPLLLGLMRESIYDN